MSRHALVSLVLLITAIAPAQTVKHYHVDASLGNDANAGTKAKPFKSVTKAVSVGTQNAVIHVRAGTYSKAATGEAFTIGIGTGTTTVRNVRILGAGAGTCILDFAGARATAAYYFQVWRNAKDVEIAHFTMQNGGTTPWYAAAVGFDCDGLHLHHCVIKNCVSGVIGWGGSKNTSIHDNIFERCRVALRFRQSSTNGARNNRFAHNLVLANTGVHAVSLSGNDPTQTLVNNIVVGSKGIGFDLGAPATGIVFANNCAYLNQTNYRSTKTIPKSNLTKDPQFVDVTKSDFRLKSTSPCIESGYGVVQPGLVNDFYGNSRVSDFDANQAAIADIGIHEYPGVTLSVKNWGQGKTATFALARRQNNVPLGYLFLGIRPISVAVLPFGLIGIDLSPGVSFQIGLLAVPGSMQQKVPTSSALNDYEVYFQAFASGPKQSIKPSGRLDLIL
jgi:Protein of unknown function (DUF1565)